MIDELLEYLRYKQQSLERQLENCRNNDHVLQAELDDINERIELIQKEG